MKIVCVIFTTNLICTNEMQRKGTAMSKIINLNKTIYDIAGEYPEIVEILAELGFSDIEKPGMLQTAGRFMTLPKGAALKKISLEHMKEILEEKGYHIVG